MRYESRKTSWGRRNRANRRNDRRLLSPNETGQEIPTFSSFNKCDLQPITEFDCKGGGCSDDIVPQPVLRIFIHGLIQRMKFHWMNQQLIVIQTIDHPMDDIPWINLRSIGLII